MVLCSPKASFELAGERVCVYAGHKEMNIYLSTEEPFFYENCILLVLRELSLFAFQPSECWQLQYSISQSYKSEFRPEYNKFKIRKEGEYFCWQN